MLGLWRGGNIQFFARGGAHTILRGDACSEGPPLNSQLIPGYIYVRLKPQSLKSLKPLTMALSFSRSSSYHCDVTSVTLYIVHTNLVHEPCTSFTLKELSQSLVHLQCGVRVGGSGLA